MRPSRHLRPFSTDLQSERSVDDRSNSAANSQSGKVSSLHAPISTKPRSGASIFGRDGLLSLMDDAREGKFDIVIVEALDRLSRDQEDLAGLHKRLTFARRPDHCRSRRRGRRNPGRIRGLVSTLFLADLKHKIRRGMTGSSARGATRRARLRLPPRPLDNQACCRSSNQRPRSSEGSMPK
ncbi:hypothetical protein F2981_02695 [Sinorhizobium meliloti]|nr:hypothetical protein [Sinorhizobium meliloti]